MGGRGEGGQDEGLVSGGCRGVKYRRRVHVPRSDSHFRGRGEEKKRKRRVELSSVKLRSSPSLSHSPMVLFDLPVLY